MQREPPPARRRPTDGTGIGKPLTGWHRASSEPGYIETWRYIQVRIGYWKAKIYRERTKQEIIDGASAAGAVPVVWIINDKNNKDMKQTSRTLTLLAVIAVQATMAQAQYATYNHDSPNRTRLR